MDNVNYLLRELNILNKHFQMQDDTKEVFNVFDSMMKRTDEKYLHSRFISILLDPHATHKTKDNFLKLFLQVVNVDFDYNLDYLEIYPNEAYRSEYKNIDILLIDRHTKSALIIENKIYAPDSNHKEEGQLEKYYRSIIEEGIPSSSINVIYLTLDREEPSHESVATSKRYPELESKVRNIHYGKHILTWLDECAKESYDKPFIRETIIQYSNLIEKMTNTNISETQIKELMDVIGRSRDNLRGAQLLINNLYNIQETSIWYFWNELTLKLKEVGYSIRKAITKQECNNLIYGNSRSNKVDFNLEIISPKGSYLTISLLYLGSLCVCVTKDDGNNGQANKALHFFNSKKDSLHLDADKDCYFYKVIYFPKEYCDHLESFGHENPSLYFLDYYNDLYLNLISSSERKKIVSHTYTEIDKLVKEYESFKI